MSEHPNMATPSLAYYPPGAVVKGVMWCAITKRGETWSRQLCMALKLAKKPDPPKPDTGQLTLF